MDHQTDSTPGAYRWRIQTPPQNSVALQKTKRQLRRTQVHWTHSSWAAQLWGPNCVPTCLPCLHACAIYLTFFPLATSSAVKPLTFLKIQNVSVATFKVCNLYICGTSTPDFNVLSFFPSSHYLLHLHFMSIEQFHPPQTKRHERFSFD